jgi:hypothetical protein
MAELGSKMAPFQLSMVPVTATSMEVLPTVCKPAIKELGCMPNVQSSKGVFYSLLRMMKFMPMFVAASRAPHITTTTNLISMDSSICHCSTTFWRWRSGSCFEPRPRTTESPMAAVGGRESAVWSSPWTLIVELQYSWIKCGSSWEQVKLWMVLVGDLVELEQRNIR